MSAEDRRRKIRTLLAKAGGHKDDQVSGAVPPVRLSTTYIRNQKYELPGGRLYGRDDNPGFEAVEDVIRQLEEGADAALFSSGMAASSAIAANLKPGDVVVLPDVCYFGIRHWMAREAERVGFELRTYAPGNHESLQMAIGEGPVRLVWAESPANPTWEVTGIRETARLAHEAGARLVVDSTAVTPILCQPLTLGADIVMHSATKYLNGHTDVVAGILITAADDDEWKAIKEVRYTAGAIAGPFEAWLLLRGMRTLYLRVAEASKNAMRVARFLEGHSKVSVVLYPGLESHPGHQTALGEWDTEIGFGGMLSVRLKDGRAAAEKVAVSTGMFLPATSLGGVESLIEHRAAVEDAASLVPDDLLRLSIGIEDADDLIEDLGAALDQI